MRVAWHEKYRFGRTHHIEVLASKTVADFRRNACFLSSSHIDTKYLPSPPTPPS
jgi:hypothetical protein